MKTIKEVKEVVVTVKYVGTDEEGHPYNAESTFKFAPDEFWMEQSRPVHREYTTGGHWGVSQLKPQDHMREVIIRGKPKLVEA